MWYHLLAISCNEWGIAFGGGGVPNKRGGCCTCSVGCKIQPVDGYVAVCLVLTIDIYGTYGNSPACKGVYWEKCDNLFGSVSVSWLVDFSDLQYWLPTYLEWIKVSCNKNITFK